MAVPKSLNRVLGMVPLLIVPVLADGAELAPELAADRLQAASEILDASEQDLGRKREAESRERAEARAVAQYRELRERLVADPGGVKGVFADALKSGGQGPAMVTIPAGVFRMGCVSGLDCRNNEEPVHDVAIPHPFALSVHEVTFEDYDRFTYPNKVANEFWGRGQRPVINVSWDDAREYVAWLSSQTGAEYQLPSEAEWEYAARAGSVAQYGWGNQVGRSRANCGDCGSQWDGARTAPVGSFAPNAWGVHDMHGNVWEWVEDCWSRTVGTTATRGRRRTGARGLGASATCAFCAAGPGAPLRGPWVPRTGAGSPPATAAASSGSAWPERSRAL